MISFRDFISEAKSVGIVYHFTNRNALLSLIEDKFVFISHYGHLSTTRNFNLSRDIKQLEKYKYITTDKGFVVRFAFDGDKISNNFKVRPVLGLAAQHKDVFSPPVSHSERVARDEGEHEEIISHSSYKFDLRKFIVSIDLYPALGQSDIDWWNQHVVPKLNDLNVKHEIVRRWTPIKEEVILNQEELIIIEP